jgi:hypothetical protein
MLLPALRAILVMPGGHGPPHAAPQVRQSEPLGVLGPPCGVLGVDVMVRQTEAGCELRYLPQATEEDHGVHPINGAWERVMKSMTLRAFAFAAFSAIGVIPAIAATIVSDGAIVTVNENAFTVQRSDDGTMVPVTVIMIQEVGDTEAGTVQFAQGDVGFAALTAFYTNAFRSVEKTPLPFSNLRPCVSPSFCEVMEGPLPSNMRSDIFRIRREPPPPPFPSLTTLLNMDPQLPTPPHIAPPGNLVLQGPIFLDWASDPFVPGGEVDVFPPGEFNPGGYKRTLPVQLTRCATVFSLRGTVKPTLLLLSG